MMILPGSALIDKRKNDKIQCFFVVVVFAFFVGAPDGKFATSFLIFRRNKV